MEALETYGWPGNVRELANLLEGAASLLPEGEHVITRIPPVVERARLRADAQVQQGLSGVEGLVPEGQVPTLEEVERRAFEYALRQCGGNVARAAKALGVAKATFYSKMRRYGLMASKPLALEQPVRLLGR